MEFGNNKIILFDGICNLCNGAVLFIIERDSKDVFKFAALQSETGSTLIQEHNIDTEKIDSIVLIDQGKVYVKSSAALRIAKGLNGAWPLLYLFIVIPPFVRNWVYDRIAKNRYHWFGKMDRCMTPSPSLQKKFI